MVVVSWNLVGNFGTFQAREHVKSGASRMRTLYAAGALNSKSDQQRLATCSQIQEPETVTYAEALHHLRLYPGRLSLW
jgi:hypothetical protein